MKLNSIHRLKIATDCRRQQPVLLVLEQQRRAERRESRCALKQLETQNFNTQRRNFTSPVENRLTAASISGLRIKHDTGSPTKSIVVLGLTKYAFVATKAFSTKAYSVNPRTMMDFFGEPVTFFTRKPDSEAADTLFSTDKVSTTMSCIDSYILSVISRGKLAKGGGDDQGLAAQAAHSSAMGISDLIHAIHDWCYRTTSIDKTYDVICDAPMLAALTLSPLLASVGIAYLRELDEEYLSRAFLSKNEASTKIIPMVDVGLAATKFLGDTSWKDYNGDKQSELFPREIMHLYALKYLLLDDLQTAGSIYTKVLEQCPGDAVALSVIIELAKMLGKPEIAFRAAASTASYWHERSRRSIIGQTAISGHSLGSSLIAVGLAMGKRYKEAELLADKALQSDGEGSSGLSTWALSLSYNAEGRVSEGRSLLSGFDGSQQYEECGFLFFNSYLGGNGAQFVLDQDSAHANRVALRVYDEHFDRILQYSGYHDSTSGSVLRMRPGSRRTQLTHSIWGNILSSLTNRAETKGREPETLSQPRLTVEDVFSWLPPTHEVLSQATFLLFRLTMSGVVAYDDTRWRDISEAWLKQRRIQDKYRVNKIIYEFSPLTRIIACMVLDGIYIDSIISNTISSRLEKVSHLLGYALKLKNVSNMSTKLIQENEIWMEISKTLSDVRSGYDSQIGTILINDVDIRSIDLQAFWEYTVFYAAMKTKSNDALCMARSVCSEGITLRPNSPDNWHRYSVILEQLGDIVAAEEAREAAVSLGSGEGGRFGEIQ